MEKISVCLVQAGVPSSAVLCSSYMSERFTSACACGIHQYSTVIHNAFPKYIPVYVYLCPLPSMDIRLFHCTCVGLKWMWTTAVISETSGRIDLRTVETGSALRYCPCTCTCVLYMYMYADLYTVRTY